MKQMKEEQQRRRMVEAKRNREIAQLKKEQRRQEVRVHLIVCVKESDIFLHICLLVRQYVYEPVYSVLLLSSAWSKF